MNLHLQHELVTGRFVAPFAANWLEPASGITVMVRPAVTAGDVAPDDAALLPAAEIAFLQETHQIVPDAGVVAAGVGPVVLATPRRPDAIDRTDVRLGGVSGVAELVARATLEPYFGIPAGAWRRDDAETEAEIREGNAALLPVTDGFREDLARAWFILTGLPLVTHVLVAPRDMSREAAQPLLDTMRVAGEVGHERRQEWRNEWIERHGLERERALALLAGLRYALGEEDRTAVMALFQRAARGTRFPRVSGLQYLPTA